MNQISYCNLRDISISDWLELLNSARVREHLIEHDIFDEKKLQLWLDEKERVNGLQGCCVRAVEKSGEFVGWCGIQSTDNEFELAIILSDKHWGAGKQVFRELMQWAKELGHKEVVVNLLDTRREYEFLKRLAKEVCEREVMSRQFTQYRLVV